jgi:hypothetical protein
MARWQDRVDEALGLNDPAKAEALLDAVRNYKPDPDRQAALADLMTGRGACVIGPGHPAYDRARKEQ